MDGEEQEAPGAAEPEADERPEGKRGSAGYVTRFIAGTGSGVCAESRRDGEMSACKHVSVLTPCSPSFPHLPHPSFSTTTILAHFASIVPELRLNDLPLMQQERR